MAIIQLTEEDLGNQMSEGLVLVYFQASYHLLSKTMGSIVEETARNYGEEIKVAIVDIEEQRRIASQLGARTAPEYCMWKDGKLLERDSMPRAQKDLENFINKYL